MFLLDSVPIITLILTSHDCLNKSGFATIEQWSQTHHPDCNNDDICLSFNFKFKHVLANLHVIVEALPTKSTLSQFRRADHCLGFDPRVERGQFCHLVFVLRSISTVKDQTFFYNFPFNYDMTLDGIFLTISDNSSSSCFADRAAGFFLGGILPWPIF